MPSASQPKMTGEQLKKYREKTKRTQAEFAKNFRLSLGALQKYEQGQRPVPDMLAHTIRLEKRVRNLEDISV